MSGLAATLDKVAMIAANFGDGVVIPDVLNDWFAFLGGKPGQVIFVDNGSDEPTQQACFRCYREGLIDKLVLVRPNHCDTGYQRGYIAEHTSPAIATKPYLLWFHIDTLPYRQGHDNWLEEAIGQLERPEVFAVGGSFNKRNDWRVAWPGWYYSGHFSENFALMKRSSFIAAMEEYAGGYVCSGFAGENPAAATRQERFLIELAMEKYMARHEKWTLVREETAQWTVFHTNVHGERLAKVRQDYLARRDIQRHLNAGFTHPILGGCYYGQPPMRLKRLRVALGASPLGPYWRRMKRWLGWRAAGAGAAP